LILLDFFKQMRLAQLPFLESLAIFRRYGVQRQRRKTRLSVSELAL